MRLTNRKPLRRPEYDYTAAGKYFVTVCTAQHMCLLGEVGAGVPTGPCVKLSEIGTIVNGVLAQMPTVEKYVVMPNHIHIIFHLRESGTGPMSLPEGAGPMSLPEGAGPMRTSAPTPSIPNLVRYFKRMVTQTYGVNIWQRSYHDHIIRNTADYERIWTYIDENPARWAEDRYYTVPGEISHP